MTKKTVFLTMVAMLMMVMVLPVTASAKKKGLEITGLEKAAYDIDTKTYGIPVEQSKVQLKVKYNGKNVTKKAKYKSSKKKAFTISKKGVLTMKGSGKAKITVKYAGKTLTFKVKKHKHNWRKSTIQVSVEVDGKGTWTCDTCGGTDGLNRETHAEIFHNGVVQPSHYNKPTENMDIPVYFCPSCGTEKAAPGYEDLYEKSESVGFEVIIK